VQRCYAGAFISQESRDPIQSDAANAMFVRALLIQPTGTLVSRHRIITRNTAIDDVPRRSNIACTSYELWTRMSPNPFQSSNSIDPSLLSGFTASTHPASMGVLSVRIECNYGIVSVLCQVNLGIQAKQCVGLAGLGEGLTT
jgi:hypothetical protein